MKHSRLCLLALLLVACQDRSNEAPPTVQIVAPSAGTNLSGVATVSVQAEAAGGVQRVSVYVRPAGTSGKGTVVGGASAAPYRVGWSTFEQPSGLPLELVAEATGSGGASGRSDPVPVQVNNTGTPTLTYLAAISYPAVPLGASSVRVTRPAVDPPAVRPPDGHLAPTAVPRGPRPMAASRRNDLEWGWNPVTGADGYGVFLATDSLAGPYVRQRNQAAGGTGEQGYAVSVAGEPGDQYAGAVSTINGSAESGLSNATEATILPEPQVATPANGQAITGGRPTLTWTPTAGAGGYLYYVYDQDPTGQAVTAVWSNYPKTSQATAAPYPTELTALKGGTYYWRVAAVRFDAANRANSFSFSAVRTFVVP